MKHIFYLSLILLLITAIGCESTIKNTKDKVEEESGTEVSQTTDNQKQSDPIPPVPAAASTDMLLGFWVGDFEKDKESKKVEAIAPDDGLYWNRNNKINISIDEIKDGKVKGHSVVAGNDRPFEGTVKKVINEELNAEVYAFDVREPGDDKYDGTFQFEIRHSKLVGIWTAYKDIEIKHRKYSLSQREFAYDPNIELESVRRYADWNKFIKTKEKIDYGDGEEEEWIRKEFSSATGKIYDINASNTLLKKEDVENLKSGDLTIIRNTIYARHGYSFKNRPLRVFFDAQDWYIPVHADIRSDFTEIEKKNIKLLLSFEKNAKEYYDAFGRG